MNPLARLTVAFGETWSQMSERERKLVVIMSSVAAITIIVGALVGVDRLVASVDDESNRIREVMAEMEQKAGKLAERRETERAAARRYARPAPQLGSFVDARAKEHGLAIREFSDQPPDQVGKFTRRALRFSLSNVGYRAAIELIASIENQAYPIAVERLQIRHYQSGVDKYDLDLTVAAYDAPAGAIPSPAAATKTAPSAAGRVGPPPPP